MLLALSKYLHLCCLLTSCLSFLGTFHHPASPNISLPALLRQHSELSLDCSFIAGGDLYLSTPELSLLGQSAMSDCLFGILSWVSCGHPNFSGWNHTPHSSLTHSSPLLHFQHHFCYSVTQTLSIGALYTPLSVFYLPAKLALNISTHFSPMAKASPTSICITLTSCFSLSFSLLIFYLIKMLHPYQVPLSLLQQAHLHVQIPPLTSLWITWLPFQAITRLGTCLHLFLWFHSYLFCYSPSHDFCKIS